MNKGMKTLLIIIAVLAVILIVIVYKKKQETPESTWQDVFTALKNTLASKPIIPATTA